MNKPKQGRWMDLSEFLEARDHVAEEVAGYDAEQLADEGLTLVDAEDVFEEL